MNAVPSRRVPTSVQVLYVVAVAATLLVAAANLLPAGPSLTAALTLLGAMTLASVVGVPRTAAARVAAAVLLVLTGRRRRPDVLEPDSVRQQDPSTPGRPQPRAPGASLLPLTA